MTEEKLILEEINNALRIFEKAVTRPQYKALKWFTRWVIRKWTTILSKLWNKSITVKKEVEKISKHLWNIDIVKIVIDKAVRIIKKTFTDLSIIAYDESDIFKPDSKDMPGLKRVRDGSTGHRGNWYVMRGVNVDGISLACSIDELSEEETYKKIKDKDSWNVYKIKQVIDNTIELLGTKGTWVIDRWSDIVEIFEYMMKKGLKFIIRAKKNKKLIALKTWETKKAWDYKIGTYDVEIGSSWTRLKFHKIESLKWKNPIMFYTNTDYSGEKCLDIYLKRWSVKEDFKKIKNKLWLEDIRVFNMLKIKNIIAILQFILILSQDMYKRVMERANTVCHWIYLYYKEFCRMQSVSMNPYSFITYLSEKLPLFHSNNVSSRQNYWLFNDRGNKKKMGCI